MPAPARRSWITPMNSRPASSSTRPPMMAPPTRRDRPLDARRSLLVPQRNASSSTRLGRPAAKAAPGLDRSHGWHVRRGGSSTIRTARVQPVTHTSPPHRPADRSPTTPGDRPKWQRHAADRPLGSAQATTRFPHPSASAERDLCARRRNVSADDACLHSRQRHIREHDEEFVECGRDRDTQCRLGSRNGDLDAVAAPHRSRGGRSRARLARLGRARKAHTDGNVSLAERAAEREELQFASIDLVFHARGRRSSGVGHPRGRHQRADVGPHRVAWALVRTDRCGRMGRARPAGRHRHIGQGRTRRCR